MSAPPGIGSTPPPAAPPPEYRFAAGPGVPSWAVGRTATEVLGITTNAVDALARFNQQPQGIQPPPQQYQQQTTYQPAQIRDDDFVDGRTFRAALEQAGQQINPAIQASIDLSASAVLGMVQNENKSMFDKYGPEIHAELSRLPRNAWTIDNLRTVVKYVRGNHLDEIAEERARQMIASGESSFRAGGGGGLPGTQTTQSTNPLESEELPAEYRDLMRKQGITRDTLRDFCRSNGMTEEDWFKMAKTTGSALITEGPKGSPRIERGVA